jgi:tripartite ATP-independent transporter DctP family solute receptor
LLHFQELLEKGSNGEIEVRIFPSSQLGPDREMIESVQTSVIEIAVPPSSFFAGWDSAFSVIELPYMYPSKDVALKVLNGAAGDEMLKKLEAQYLVGLGWLENGMRHVTNNVRPILSPEDLSGIKLRTMKVPAHVDTFTALGANPTPMNFGEVYSGLQQGVIDGQENPIALIDAQRFYEVQKYMSLTGHVYTTYIPVISKIFFDELSAEYQALLLESMKKAADYQQELVNAEESNQLEKIKQSGVEVVELSEEQLMALQELTESVRAKYREPIGEQAFDTWVEAVKSATAN